MRINFFWCVCVCVNIFESENEENPERAMRNKDEKLSGGNAKKKKIGKIY